MFKRNWTRRLKRLFVRRACIAALLCVMIAGGVFALLWVMYPFPRMSLKEARAGGSALILDSKGGLIAWRVSSTEEWRLPVRIDEVSPWLIKATVAAEDKRFFSHQGVDPVAVCRAVCQNISSGRRVSGASTITMQAIRLIHPRRRTYSAKAVESFRALQLEHLGAKSDVLEIYFNLAPYGGNIVGASAAARRFFGKNASDLSLGEAALLAGIPQRPARFDPRTHLSQAEERREFVFERMEALGLATRTQIDAARRERIDVQRPSVATDAPRFADFVLGARSGEGGVIRTTIDPQLQNIARKETTGHAAMLRNLGIDGAAVVILDTQNSKLLAMVGAADPSDPLVGCVNCAVARRQPGSLLKPFLYAAAFDTGVLTPRSVVYDVPTSWRGYRPENIDKRYLGPIPASRALRASRNLPAVRLLKCLGPKRLARDINLLGLKVRAGRQRCGLTLALGTAEVRLLDIANAYAALGRLGVYRPLRIRVAPDIEGEESGSHERDVVDVRPSKRVLSEGAAYMTLQCLSNRTFTRAWKTGTSWKHRDAWGVVVTPRYVVGAWCGRLSGDGHPALIGARIALPLAFAVTNQLPHASEEMWRRPERVATRRVCSLSGAPASLSCPSAVTSEYLPGISRDVPCRLHRATGSDDGSETDVFWPPEVASYMTSRSDSDQPEGGERSHRSITITTPGEGAEYVIPPPGFPADRSLSFRSRTTADVERVYWFLDGELIGSVAPDEVVRWTMQPGRYELVASDASGIAHRIRFAVVGRVGREIEH